MKMTEKYDNYLNWLKNKVSIHKGRSDSAGGNIADNDKPLTSTTISEKSSKSITINSRIFSDSLIKLDPRYLAKNNPVMFTVEVGFIVVLVIGLFPNISAEFVNGSQVFYIECAIILILTVWFATFSESLSEAQARG